jgi:serine/tyrosine/threonine adenylyltransferase
MTSPDVPAIKPMVSDPRADTVSFGFENTYARLPERFYARLAPTPVTAPNLIKLNVELARELRIDPNELMTAQGVEILAGNHVAEGSEPIALAYAGHQFGHFVPQLGDGRAILLGEVMGLDRVRYDIQLKGSGPTPFSRRGDGRAVLGPVLREYILSEAMAALGVPTARALAAVTTGERVLRETVLPGAVFTRVAASHLRVGTFEYFAARRDTEGIRVLADYAIARHYPEAAQTKRPFRALLDAVIARQAELIARWMCLGFIHGVMNTDNTSISAETIDYGPCAFMEAYDPATVFSSIDAQGRYAYGNQPRIALWNLTRLAEALLPLLQQEEGGDEAALASANEALAAFPQIFESFQLSGFRRKLGLFSERDSDQALIQDLLERMTAHRADFTLTFRTLCHAAETPEGDTKVRALFANPEAYDAWAIGWRLRLKEESVLGSERSQAMRRVNPAFIPRNHLVEAAIRAAVERQDFQPFEDLLEITSRPYDDQPGRERYAAPAGSEERVTQTFCGT